MRRSSLAFGFMIAVWLALTIDGKLDEAVYRTEPAIGEFVQQEPREGQPSTEKTEAWDPMRSRG